MNSNETLVADFDNIRGYISIIHGDVVFMDNGAELKEQNLTMKFIALVTGKSRPSAN